MQTTARPSWFAVCSALCLASVLFSVMSGLWSTPGMKQPGLRVVKTNKVEAEDIHRYSGVFCVQFPIFLPARCIARFMFANNISFNALTSKHFQQLINIIRPGLRPLTRCVYPPSSSLHHFSSAAINSSTSFLPKNLQENKRR